MQTFTRFEDYYARIVASLAPGIRVALDQERSEKLARELAEDAMLLAKAATALLCQEAGEHDWWCDESDTARWCRVCLAPEPTGSKADDE